MVILCCKMINTDYFSVFVIIFWNPMIKVDGLTFTVCHNLIYTMINNLTVYAQNLTSLQCSPGTSFPGGNQMVPGGNHGNQKTKEILELEPGLFITTIESCQVNRIAANRAGL